MKKLFLNIYSFFKVSLGEYYYFEFHKITF